MLTRVVSNPVPNRRFTVEVLLLTTCFIFPMIDYITFRFREMDASAGSDNEAPLLMAVSMGFSSIPSPLDEASAILIWADRYSI